MKKFAWLAAVVCLCLVCLAVCRDKDTPGSSAVLVDRKGRISAWFVEDFAEDYYSLGELVEMAKGEVAEYNALFPGRKTAVKVEKVKMLPDDSGKIMVSYRYDGWESYTGFSGQNLFYGTVEEAAKAGYGADAVLKSVADGSLSAGDQLSLWAEESGESGYAGHAQQAGERLGISADSHVIVTDVKAKIYCPREVTHISDGAFVNADGSIDTSNAEGMVYILMK